ncbi:MAG: hypothetical protein V8S22_05090 [Lachnospiraceae bacterium]
MAVFWNFGRGDFGIRNYGNCVQLRFPQELSHRLQLLLMAIVAVGVGSVFRFDLLGYDTWLPDDKIASMSVNNNGRFNV